MTKIEEIEYSFNPRLSVPNYETYLSDSKLKAKIAENNLIGKTDIKYGKATLQKLDVFYKNNTSNLPIHIFIHGGYWRALDKSYHTHMAIPFVEKQICFFNINYELCPKVKLSEIKNQIIEAILWIYRNAAKFKANNQNIVISGHSAGAHLASLMLSVDWKKYGLNNAFLKGIALVSGIYETERVLDLDINKEIRLTKEEAKKNDPHRMIPKIIIPTIISYGEKEPELWKKQSIDYMSFLNKNRFNCKEIVCENDNHFSLIDTLSNYKHLLVKKMINLSYNKK